MRIHLLEDHNLCNKSDFNNYELFILDICSPKSLELNEHRVIQSLKTIKPKGTNSMDPFGIPLLDLLWLLFFSSQALHNFQSPLKSFTFFYWDSWINLLSFSLTVDDYYESTLSSLKTWKGFRPTPSCLIAWETNAVTYHVTQSIHW